jgi:hypothetical protein
MFRLTKWLKLRVMESTQIDEIIQMISTLEKELYFKLLSIIHVDV